MSLKEAIEFMDGWVLLAQETEVVAAARAYEEGEDIWWCEEHGLSNEYADEVCRGADATPCRMVSRRVCPQIEGEDG